MTLRKRSGHVTRRSGLRLRPEEEERLDEVRNTWTDADARWSRDPVRSLCATLISHAADDVARLKQAAKTLMTARHRARNSLAKLERASRTFSSVLAESRSPLSWLHSPQFAPIAHILDWEEEVIRRHVVDSLGQELLNLATRAAPFSCPMCGHFHQAIKTATTDHNFQDMT